LGEGDGEGAGALLPVQATLARQTMTIAAHVAPFLAMARSYTALSCSDRPMRIRLLSASAVLAALAVHRARGNPSRITLLPIRSVTMVSAARKAPATRLA